MERTRPPSCRCSDMAYLHAPDIEHVRYWWQVNEKCHRTGLPSQECDECVEQRQKIKESKGVDGYLSIMNAIPYLVGHQLLPFLNYPLQRSLSCLRWNINEKADLLLFNRIQWLKYGYRLRQASCARTERQAAADVYLSMSSIDLSAASNSSRDVQADVNMSLAERLQPSKSHVVRHFLHSQHWAVSIRGITYEILRRKGSRDIELKITSSGSDTFASAFGVPLTSENVEKLGVTFLPDEAVRSLLESRSKPAL